MYPDGKNCLNRNLIAIDRSRLVVEFRPMRFTFSLLLLSLCLVACVRPESIPAQAEIASTATVQVAQTATPEPSIITPSITPTLDELPASPTEAIASPAAEPSPLPLSKPTTLESVVAELIADNPPTRDDVRLAAAYLGANPTQATPRPSVEYQVGMVESFYISNVDNNTVNSIDAELMSIGDNAYFWFDKGPGSVEPDPAELARVTASFDEIYDSLYAYFGVSEPVGGRVHIVHAAPDVLCAIADQCHLAGYFSSRDLLPQSVRPQSNERPMFVMNVQQFGTGNYLDVLAHELRHMLGSEYEAGEEDWFVEGGAMFAEELAGFTFLPQLRGNLFLEDPDRQLNNWTDGDTIPYYGRGYLLNRFIYDRLGTDLYREFILSGEPGLRGIDDVAQKHDLDLTGDQLWLDWLAAMALQDAKDVPAEYQWIGPTLNGAATTPINNLPANFETTVHQYAADYYELPSSGEVTIEFSGQPTVPLLNAALPSGDRYWYAQRANDSNPRLTRAIDLRAVDEATLEYDVFVDIEAGYDFAYVAVSADDGQTWQPLEAEGMQGLRPEDDPSDSALAPRFYTGRSGAWVSESIDLSEFAGQEILLRFEYVTDPILTFAGFAVDNIAIREIDFFDDAETLDEGWIAEGFTRVTSRLPQQWPLQLITFDDDGRPSVERLVADGDGRLSHTFQALPGTRRPLLIVAAIAPETLELAHYSLAVR